MDLNTMGLICDNKPVRGKELDEFTRKVNLLTAVELKSALQASRVEMSRVLNEAVPCVGCRRRYFSVYSPLTLFIERFIVLTVLKGCIRNCGGRTMLL